MATKKKQKFNIRQNPSHELMEVEGYAFQLDGILCFRHGSRNSWTISEYRSGCAIAFGSTVAGVTGLATEKLRKHKQGLQELIGKLIKEQGICNPMREATIVKPKRVSTVKEVDKGMMFHFNQHAHQFMCGATTTVAGGYKLDIFKFEEWLKRVGYDDRKQVSMQEYVETHYGKGAVEFVKSLL